MWSLVLVLRLPPSFELAYLYRINYFYSLNVLLYAEYDLSGDYSVLLNESNGLLFPLVVPVLLILLELNYLLALENVHNY